MNSPFASPASVGHGAAFLAEMTREDPNETLPTLLLKLHAQRPDRSLRSGFSTTVVLLLRGPIEDDVIHQLHTLEFHVVLIQIAADSDTYLEGDGFVVSTDHPSGYFKGQLTPTQEYFHGIIECLLFATHYLIRYAGTEYFRLSRAAFFADRCRRVWNKLWEHRHFILAHCDAISPGSFRKILADAILHYVILHIHVL